MTKTLTTAADRDALIAEAAQYGVTITRTAKDFFAEIEGTQTRVTPTQIRAMIADEQERRAAFEAAADRTSEAQTQEMATPAPVAAEPDAQPIPVQAPATMPVPATEEPAKVVIKYGPPCGGTLAHLAIATSEDARNPLIHVDVPVSTRYKSKEEAAAAGRGQQTTDGGWLAFMAHDTQAEQFWALATVDATGQVLVDGQAVTLELLDDQAATAIRAKLGKRLQAKSQWRATAA